MSECRTHLVSSEKKSFCTCSAGEEVEITYSYWDGSGHRRHVKVSASLVHFIPSLQLSLVMKTDLGMGLLIFQFAFSSSPFIINMYAPLDAEG